MRDFAVKPAKVKFLSIALKQAILPLSLRLKELKKTSERAKNKLKARIILVSNGLQM